MHDDMFCAAATARAANFDVTVVRGLGSTMVLGIGSGSGNGWLGSAWLILGVLVHETRACQPQANHNGCLGADPGVELACTAPSVSTRNPTDTSSRISNTESVDQHEGTKYCRS